MLNVVAETGTRTDDRLSLDAICRDGARRMLAAALEVEAAAYIESFVDAVDDDGHRLVVRNGHARKRDVATVAGAIEIEAPRVNDQRVDPATGVRQAFRSSIIPPWARKSPKVTEVLALMYLHGMSTGDFAPALTGFFGSAAGLSASAVGRLLKVWQDEHRAFMARDLADRDFVYVWVDGIHFNVRLDEARLCCLVMLGVRCDGTKELIAITDGHREAKESWADLIRACKRRGMRAPTVAIGDGALGFWAALRDTWPTTVVQRCWVHKTKNVLACLPTAAQPTAHKMLSDIHTATDKNAARKAVAKFEEAYLVKFPKAVAKITSNIEELLAFYDYPAEHWVHLKTTNPIESTFATVRLRSKITKGAGSRAAGLAMAYKLIESAQDRWRKVNGHELVAAVRAGATFEKGILIEPNTEVAA